MGTTRTPSQQGGGAAGGIPQVSLVNSPTGADFYSAAAGVLDGADDFVLGLWMRYEALVAPTGAGATSVVQNLSVGAGWRLDFNFGPLDFQVHDGSKNFTSCQVLGYYDPGAAFAVRSTLPTRDVVVLCRAQQSGGVLTLDALVNGAQLGGPVAAAAAGMTPSTGTLQVGGAFGGGAVMPGGIGALAYYEGTVTDAQLLEYSDACLGQADLVAAPWGWLNRWSAKENPPGATWAPSDGAVSLTRNGAPTLLTRYLRAA